MIDQLFRKTLLESEETHLRAITYSVISSVSVEDDGSVFVNNDEIYQAVDPLDLNAELTPPSSKEKLWQAGKVNNLRPIKEPEVGQWTFLEDTSNGNGLSLTFKFSWELQNSSTQQFLLRVSDPGENYKKSLSEFRRVLWIWLTLGFVTLLLLQWLLVEWSLTPLKEVAEEVEAIEKSGQKEFRKIYPKELMPLVSNINSLLQFERKQKSRYRQTLDNLAHALKTPLTAIKNVLDMKGQQESQPQEIAEQVKRIQQIVDYQIGKASVTQSSPFIRSLPTALLVGQIKRSLQKVYADKNLIISTEVPEELLLKMDEGDFTEMIGNLMENAAKYCNSKVTVTFRNKQSPILIIEDDGEGIPEHLSLTAIQRGVRLDERAEGTGIGLSVAYEILSSCGGQMHIGTSETLGGTKISLSF